MTVAIKKIPKPKAEDCQRVVPGCITTTEARNLALSRGFTEWESPLGWARLERYWPQRIFVTCWVHGRSLVAETKGGAVLAFSLR